MSGRRAESLDFHNPTRQRGMAFFIPRSVSKECLGQGKNTAKVSPSLTLWVVIILKYATSKLKLRVVKLTTVTRAVKIHSPAEKFYKRRGGGFLLAKKKGDCPPKSPKFPGKLGFRQRLRENSGR